MTRRGEPSGNRADMPKPQLAFPPVGVLPMCNLRKTASMLVRTLQYVPLRRGIDEGTAVKVSFYPETLVLLSRPMFAMRLYRQYQQALRTEIMESTLDSARHKLLDGIDITKCGTISHDLDLASLAVLGCRFGVSSTNARHKQLLVRNHLATCFDMSPYGTDLVVGYQSEPLLAEVAARMMQRAGAVHVLLATLYRLMVRGSLALSSGNRDVGELVVCITLSRAFDMVCARHHREAWYSPSRSSVGTAAIAARISNAPLSTFGRPIPLVEVLVELYGGSDPVKADQTRQEILAIVADNALGHGIVMFNHFIKSSNDPIRDVASYKTLLRRGAAMVYTHGEAAKNIVIPVALPKAPDRAIDLWDSDSYVLTTWEIHVNNWQAASHVRNVVSQMVATPTTDAVDRGFPVIVSTSTPTGAYPVPILYQVFNTRSDPIDVPQAVGRVLLFDRHWAMPVSATAAAETSSQGMYDEDPPNDETRLDGEEVPPAVKRSKRTHLSSNDVSPTETILPDVQEETSLAASMQVVALQLSGVPSLPMFDEAERSALEKLLVLSDDTTIRRQLHHETFLQVSAEEARQRVACLRPEHDESTIR
eukprot:gene6528-4703_t